MSSWHQQLDEAGDAAEVIAVARDYLATWTPEEIARLPLSCRPGRIRAASDLVHLHECAVDAFRATRESGEELKALQMLTAFLVRANLRLVQVASREDAAPPDAPPRAAPPKRQSKARDP